MGDLIARLVATQMIYLQSLRDRTVNTLPLHYVKVSASIRSSTQLYVLILRLTVYELAGFRQDYHVNSRGVAGR